MKEVESFGLEREIILIVNKNQKSISEVSKIMKKSIQTVSKTVERMKKQDLIIKTIDYLGDARLSKIQVNRERVRVARTHTFYLRYFTIAFSVFFLTAIAGFVLNFPFLVVGSLISTLPTLLYMFYNAYIAEDKVIVYKKPKKVKKDSVKKEVDNVNNQVDNV